MGYREQKIENLLETPLTKMIKWTKMGWNKFVTKWRVPQYTFATLLILNSLGLFWHIMEYWVGGVGTLRGTEKTFSGCFKYLIETQLPWNISALVTIGTIVFWCVVIAIPALIAVAIFAGGKKK